MSFWLLHWKVHFNLLFFSPLKTFFSEDNENMNEWKDETIWKIVLNTVKSHFFFWVEVNQKTLKSSKTVLVQTKIGDSSLNKKVVYPSFLIQVVKQFCVLNKYVSRFYITLFSQCASSLNSLVMSNPIYPNLWGFMLDSF